MWTPPYTFHPIHAVLLLFFHPANAHTHKCSMWHSSNWCNFCHFERSKCAVQNMVEMSTTTSHYQRRKIVWCQKGIRLMIYCCRMLFALKKKSNTYTHVCVCIQHTVSVLNVKTKESYINLLYHLHHLSVQSANCLCFCLFFFYFSFFEEQEKL